MTAYTYVASSSYVHAASGGNLDMSTATGLGSRTAGNLLLLSTGTRGGTITGITIAGYTELRTSGTGSASCIGVFARICTADASDLPTTVGWDNSGTKGWQWAMIQEFSGDVWPTLSTIVAHEGWEGSATSSTLALSAVTGVTTADCLIFATSQKNANQTDHTSITHSSLTVATGGYRLTTNTSYMHVANAYRQETTAANYDGVNFVINGGTAEGSTSHSDVVLFLKSAAATTKYVQFLAHSSAASATGLEGVVLNATTKAKIGTFSGQAFDADLVSGEAQMLIACTDISPDGSTLTTADHPIVVAKNTTLGTVGLPTANVIEV